MISGQWQGFSELQRLRLDGTVRLYVSDKDGEFVVIPESLDKGITEFHLPNGQCRKDRLRRNSRHRANDLTAFV